MTFAIINEQPTIGHLRILAWNNTTAYKQIRYPSLSSTRLQPLVEFITGNEPATFPKVPFPSLIYKRSCKKGSSGLNYGNHHSHIKIILTIIICIKENCVQHPHSFYRLQMPLGAWPKTGFLFVAGIDRSWLTGGTTRHTIVKPIAIHIRLWRQGRDRKKKVD